LAGAQLQGHDPQVLAEVGIAALQFIGDAVDGGVEAEAGLHRGDQEIEHIGEALPVFPLALGPLGTDELVRSHHRGGGEAAGDQDGAEPALAPQHEGQQQDGGGGGRHQRDRTGAQVEGHRLRAGEPRQHQPMAQRRQLRGVAVVVGPVAQAPHPPEQAVERQHRGASAGQVLSAGAVLQPGLAPKADQRVAHEDDDDAAQSEQHQGHGGQIEEIAA
jgi:hypothetical protein